MPLVSTSAVRRYAFPMFLATSLLGAAALSSWAAPTKEGTPSFLRTAMELSTTHEPAEMLDEARKVSGTELDRRQIERLGEHLLSNARLARFHDDAELALTYLKAADHVFAAAPQVDGEAGKRFYLHRAIVAIEEVLVTDSDDRWADAVQWLTAHSQVDHSSAAWAHRILTSPLQYAAADRAEPTKSLGGPIHVGGDVQKPVKVFAAAPSYSEEARELGIQGVVILQVIIDRHGNVTEPKVLKDLPHLGQAAKDAVSTWLFEPATLDGQPVEVYYNLTVNFRLG